jgi:RimJ/RimL family protein N-acetyltransferase
MTEITTPLYTGKLIRLTRIDLEKDPQTLADWSQNASLMRQISPAPAYPTSAWKQKKRLEALEKQMDKERDLFYYHIRPLGDERLLGWAKLKDILWAAQSGDLELALAPSEQRRGYGSDAIQLLLRLAFHELNLHRLTVYLPAYNIHAANFVQKFGFREEVRRREGWARDGKRWDLLQFGLLKHEWSGYHE